MGHVKHRRDEAPELMPEFVEPRRSKKEEKRWRKREHNDDAWDDDDEWAGDFDTTVFDDGF